MGKKQGMMFFLIIKEINEKGNFKDNSEVVSMRPLATLLDEIIIAIMRYINDPTTLREVSGGKKILA